MRGNFWLKVLLVLGAAVLLSSFLPRHPAPPREETLSLTVTATAYGPGCDVRGQVYDGSGRPWEGTVAVSHDLWPSLHGHVLYYAGYRYRVRDLMGKQWTNRIDFYMNSCRQARAWGRRVIRIEDHGPVSRPLPPGCWYGRNKEVYCYA